MSEAVDIPEAYIDAALDTLRAELPGEILRQNGLYSDFQLPMIPEEMFVWGVRTGLVPPAVEVGVPEDALSEFPLGQVGADDDLTMVVRGWVTLDDSINDAEKLMRSTYRFGRALTNVLRAPDAFGQHVTVSELRRQWGISPATREGPAVNGSAVLVFTIAGYETFA